MTQSASLSRTLLLQRLADGQFHSGEVLGNELGLSRASVSKHVKALTELGLDIFSVTGKGYRLAKQLTLLSHKEIALNLPSANSAQVDVLNIIDSTNQYVKDAKGPKVNGYVCLAEAQTAGRGRHGRTWVSPYGASIYMSMFWSFQGGHQAISGLSLVVGIAIVKALKGLGVDDVKLKWPNDVYLQGKKLAGVLVEVEGQLGAACDCVIGIGLNVDLPTTNLAIDQPWTDLAKGSGIEVDRNVLAAALINELTTCLTEFESGGLRQYVNEWNALDFFHKQTVKLLMGDKQFNGTAIGINIDGALLLDREGKVEAYHGGEISVRPN